jgi:hypothetical protein
MRRDPNIARYNSSANAAGDMIHFANVKPCTVLTFDDFVIV